MVNFFVTKSKGKVMVAVSVEERGERGPKIRVKTHDVLVHLKKEGHRVGKCLKSAVVTNTNKKTMLGEWEFVDLTYGRKKKTSSKKKTSTKKATEEKQELNEAKKLLDDVEKLLDKTPSDDVQ